MLQKFVRLPKTVLVIGLLTVAVVTKVVKFHSGAEEDYDINAAFERYYLFNASINNRSSLDRSVEVWSEPKKHFIFYTLHKTGTRSTKVLLTDVCKHYGLRCLTFPTCQTAATGQGFNTLRNCLRDASRHDPNETVIEYGAYTEKRMHACCPAGTTQKKFDGIAEHLSQQLLANRRLLARLTHPDAVRFTIVREPVQQFLSYFYYRLERLPTTYKDDYLQNVQPSLNETIDIFYQFHLDNLSFDPHRNHTALETIYLVLTNSQSRELGWDGKDARSHGLVLQLLSRLDLIGLTDRLTATWRAMAAAFGWTSAVRKKLKRLNKKPIRTNLGKMERQPLSAEQLDKLRAIQWADRRMYNHAKSIAERQLRDFDDVVMV